MKEAKFCTSNDLEAEGHYFAIFFCECRIPAIHHTTYSEEFHLFHADSEEEARAQARARAKAQASEYDNADGQRVYNRVLNIVELGPLFFAPAQEAHYLRSLVNRAAYDQYLAAINSYEEAVIGEWLSEQEAKAADEIKPANRLQSDPVIIHPYNPDWPAQFEAIAAPIRAALGPHALSVEHIGSTSVPGLAAKPIIDLVIVISSRLHMPEVIAKLAELGYTHAGDQGIAGREVFKKSAEIRHHLYACAVDAVPLHEHLLFRDYLRMHPAEATAYAELKTKLAEQYREDRDGYTEAKTEFVRSVLAKAIYEIRLDQNNKGHQVTYPTREWFATILTKYRRQTTREVFYTEEIYTLLASELEEAEEILNSKISAFSNEFTNNLGERIEILDTEVLNVGELRAYPPGKAFERRIIRDISAYEKSLRFDYDEWFKIENALSGKGVLL